MTFEELLVLVDKMNGEAGYATGGYIDSLVYSGSDVHLTLEEIKSGIEQLQETYAPKLQIPKRMAEILDTDGLDSDNEDLDYWVLPNIPDGKENHRRALCEIYVASKVIGVELIEVIK